MCTGRFRQKGISVRLRTKLGKCLPRSTSTNTAVLGAHLETQPSVDCSLPALSDANNVIAQKISVSLDSRGTIIVFSLGWGLRVKIESNM